jgi:hypothetical protein
LGSAGGGDKIKEIYGRMTAQRGGNCTSHRKVNIGWHGNIQNREKNFIDDLHSGRPSAVTCVEVKEQVDQPIRNIRDQHCQKYASVIKTQGAKIA